MKNIKVWDSWDGGYSVPETKEVKSEVSKILELWMISNRYHYYSEDKMLALRPFCDYNNNNSDYEVRVITDDTKVVGVRLYKKVKT